MHFSVTKEVCWEADDESEDAKPALGIKKRYRFIFAFSRRASKGNDKSKRTDPISVLSEEYSAFDEEEHNFNPCKHVCFGCGEIRSDHYHEEYPMKHGKTPRPSLCTQCRFYRKVRFANCARDGGGGGGATASEARIDEREWCANCGTLRSNKYHRKLVSGESPPCNEICGHCMIAVERENRFERLRLYYEQLDMPAWSLAEKYDPLKDSLLHRRSSPYAFTPTSSPGGTKVVSSATFLSDIVTMVGHSDEPGSLRPCPAAPTTRETKPAPPGTSKASESSWAGFQKATVENHMSEDERRHARAEGQADQKTRETRQPSRQPHRQENHHGLPKEDKLNPQLCKNSAPALGPTPAPVRPPITSDDTKQRQELREPQSMLRPQPHEAVISTASTSGGINQSPEVHETRDYFNPRYLRPSKPRRQPEMKSQLHEVPTSIDAAASSNIGWQPEARETRDYFKPRHLESSKPRGQPEMKPQPRDAPAPARTTLDNIKPRQQETRRPHERHRNSRGHQKQPATSPTKSGRSQEPFYFSNPHPTGKPASPPQSSQRQRQPETQAQPKQQQRRQEERPGQPPRRMGVSDMYWASAEGKAELEQSFTAGGYFFPASAYGFASARSRRYRGDVKQEQNEKGGEKAKGEEEEEDGRHRHHAFGTSSSQHLYQTQIWEVDSDEAEEIEQGRVRLLRGGGTKSTNVGGAKGKGKARMA